MIWAKLDLLTKVPGRKKLLSRPAQPHPGFNKYDQLAMVHR